MSKIPTHGVRRNPKKREEKHVKKNCVRKRTSRLLGVNEKTQNACENKTLLRNYYPNPTREILYGFHIFCANYWGKTNCRQAGRTYLKIARLRTRDPRFQPKHFLSANWAPQQALTIRTCRAANPRFWSRSTEKNQGKSGSYQIPQRFARDGILNILFCVPKCQVCIVFCVTQRTRRTRDFQRSRR